MVMPIFQKGYMVDAAQKRMIPYPDSGTWHITPYGIADVGVMSVEVIRKREWRFSGSEGRNSQRWIDWGYKAMMTSAPILAWVPWQDVAGIPRWLARRRKADRLFLRPLSPEQVSQLNSRGISEIAFHEEFCVPHGWWCLSPYWYTRSGREYLRSLWIWMRGGQLRRWPRFVRG